MRTTRAIIIIIPIVSIAMYRLKPCFKHVFLFNLSFKLRFFPPDLIEFLLKGICKLRA
jgi:hypothetical protein